MQKMDRDEGMMDLDKVEIDWINYKSSSQWR